MGFASLPLGCRVAVRLQRTPLRVWLAIGLAVFVFEHGRHSVHHLWSHDASCVVASATVATSLGDLEASAVRHATPILLGSLADPPLTELPLRPAGHHRGRAPPRSLSS